jgi:hypothetical protein
MPASTAAATRSALVFLIDKNGGLYKGYEYETIHWILGASYKKRLVIDDNGEANKDCPLYFNFMTLVSKFDEHSSAKKPYKKRELNASIDVLKVQFIKAKDNGIVLT